MEIKQPVGEWSLGQQEKQGENQGRNQEIF